MGIFEKHGVHKGTIAEVTAMIEGYFKHRGLDAHTHRLDDTNQLGWWLKEGSATVYIVVRDNNDHHGAVLRISSPLVFIPKNNREAFYRRLLDVNANLSSCALATHENTVLVVYQRPTLGLDQEELDELVWNAAYIADLLDDKLSQEYGAPMYSEQVSGVSRS
jgi:Putative bacterial sensory transduction regulator